MKRIRTLAVATLLSLIGGFFWLGVAHGQSTSGAANQVTNKTVYAANQNVYITGHINGDVYCVGSDVVVNADVNGDVLCAGRDVNISGHVSGSIRVAAEVATVNATVGHSLSVAAETFTLGPQSSIGQDATIVGQSYDLQGTVGRDVVVRGGDLTLASTIGRNLSFTGAQLTLQSQARVKGSLTYTANAPAYLVAGAKVNGHQYYTATPTLTFKQQLSNEITSFLYMVVALLLLALALVLVAPQVVSRISEEADKSLGKVIMTGFIATFVTFIGSIILVISTIGVPLAFLVFLAWMVMAILSIPIAGFYLGKLILPKKKNAFTLMSSGCIVVLALFYIPAIGLIIIFLAYLIGFGSILLSLKNHLPDPEYTIK